MTKKQRPKKEIFAFQIRPSVRALLEQIKEREGITYTAQLERAIVMYAQSKGLVTEAA
jgi:hypothetical protein